MARGYIYLGIDMPYHHKAWLEKKYLEEQMSTYQIAEICNTTSTTIWRRLIKFGIRRRPGGGTAQKIQEKVFFHLALPKYLHKALRKYSNNKNQRMALILRRALTAYLTKEGFNPFKEK